MNSAPEVDEYELIADRIRALNSEKARIESEIATNAEQLRELFENRLIDRGHLPRPRSGRARTNFADTVTATELACLLRIPERSAHRLVQHAAVLVNHHPKTLDALRRGVISWSHATALVHEYAGLPDATSHLLEEKLLPIAADTTAPRMAYRARKLRADLHPVSLEERARTATLERRVTLEPADNAMAWLHILLDATNATAIDARLTHAARALQTPQEQRDLAQLRTDVLTDLLLTDAQLTDQELGQHPSGPSVGHQVVHPAGQTINRPSVRAHVNVTVPVLTLLGVDDAPADLEGYGPIPADVARRLAAHAPSFTRLLTHPETGTVLSVGRTNYAVPTDLKRWLRVRDRTCRHPGCSVAASRCEIDHTTPWSHAGHTSHDNLAHLCRKHHMLKSEGMWHYQHHSDGTLTAISPGGATYASALEPRID